MKDMKDTYIKFRLTKSEKNIALEMAKARGEDMSAILRRHLVRLAKAHQRKIEPAE